MSTTIDRLWTASAVDSLADYIRIPNQSPAFDPEWEENGLLDRAIDHVADWCRAHAPSGLDIEVLRVPGRTPVILMEMETGGDGTVLLYGHVDKQPPMLPWHDGLGPHDPVLSDGRLYGRGGADDGYAAYASVVALAELAERGAEVGRVVVVIEASEESGSPDLPAWLDDLGDRLGTPDLVVCLDSGCGTYDRFWLTTSLRGCVGTVVRVETLAEGVHSGDGGGIVPDTFRIARQLLDRIEDPVTGEVLLESCRVEIPPDRIDQAVVAAAAIGPRLTERFPLIEGATPLATGADAVLARTWKPALAVIGADGLPPVGDAGNVLRPSTTLAVSVRTPPTAKADRVEAELAERLTADPPSGARITLEQGFHGEGWAAPTFAPWLEEAIERASADNFGQPAGLMGEGGTIPFMAMLGDRFPDAQFLITGVLGPGSNAHGPNEFLDTAYAARLIACVADVLASPR